MVQKEKQDHMLRTAKKKYGKNIRITFAEKDVLRFVTDTQAITMKCHNNGAIDERIRKRPKMKSSALSPKDERPRAKPSELCHESGKRPKAKPSEAGQKQDEPSIKKKPVPKTASRTIPKRKVSPKTDPEDPEPILTLSEPKCPFHVGDHVKSLYSDTRYTVSAIESYSLVHVTEEGDLFGRTMSSADLLRRTSPRRGRASADLVGGMKKAKPSKHSADLIGSTSHRRGRRSAD